MHLQIIQPGKNAFFGNPQAACKDGEIEIPVRLQRIAEHIPDEVYHRIVIPGLKRPVQRNVIFVDQKDRPAAEMSGKKPGKSLQTGRHHLVRHRISLFPFCIHPNQLTVGILLLTGKPVAVLQELKSHGFLADHRPQRRSRRLKIRSVHTFQADRDHREPVHVLFAQLLLLHDLQAVEQPFLPADLKEAFQHAHVQGLSKTPRTGKQVHFAPVLQKFRDEHGFIHVIKIICDELVKPINPDRKFFALHLPRSPFRRPRRESGRFPPPACFHLTMDPSGRQASSEVR